MSFLRVQVALENDSTEPRDRSVSTWHFETNEVDDAATERATIAAALTGFFQTIDSPYLSAELSTEARIKMYDLNDAPVRAPIHDSVFALAPGTSGLPNEVAIALSYRTAIVSGIDRRRTRGRIYLGPCSENVMTAGTGDIFVAAAARTAITDAAAAMATALDAGASDITWSIFSQYNALGLAIGSDPPVFEPGYSTPQLVLGFSPIDVVWVDDAFDTQRRRGRRATTRTQVTL